MAKDDEYDISPQSTWLEYRRLILAELTRLNAAIEELNSRVAQSNRLSAEDLSRLRVDIAMLQVKAGAWGLIGGLLPVAIMLFIQFVK